MLGPDDLVITGSSLGNPPLELLTEAAVAGGFAGVSLWPIHSYAPARAEGRTPTEIAARIADAGLVVHEVDALVAWVGPGDPGSPYFEESPELLLFEAADALGARFVNVLLTGDPTASLGDCAAVFARVCDRSAEHGLTATLEFSPRRLVPDLAAACAVVRDAGRANAGVTLDTWHHHWGGAGAAEVLAAPPGAIRAVQCNDAPAEEPDDLAWATRYHRLVPGDGAIDLPGIVRALRDIGCDAPLTVEVFNDDLLAEHGPIGAARALGDAMRVIAAAARR
ncbi:MAG: sugar phosphate isomerase/epimerase [Acidimicrobiia bacterium]